MAFSPKQERELAKLGETVLRALECIAREAKNQLVQTHAATGPTLSATARRNLEHINSENQVGLRALAQEPSIARVQVQWEDTHAVEELYVCRASSAGMFPSGFNGRLVSYRSAMGRLAEIPAGDSTRIVTPTGKRKAVVRERIQLHPRLEDAVWDSRSNEFEFVDWQVVVDSLRRLLKRVGSQAPVASVLATLLAEQEARELYQDQRRRQTVDRISLRDQPVLDKYQGAVFRMPLDTRAILLGPPGTGKTTTLIRRIAQKRTREALTEDEIEQLDRHGLMAEFMSSDSWAMFSPTELLKLYVREAFNRESVPAASWNLRTWESERLSLGRETFRFLKGASSGRFTIASSDDLIQDTTSPSLAAIHDEFSDEVDSVVLDRCAAAFRQLEATNNPVSNRAIAYLRSRRRIPPFNLDAIHAIANDNEIFRSTVAELTDAIDARQRALADELLQPNPMERLQELSELLRSGISGQNEEDDELSGETSEISSSEGPSRAETARVLLRGIGQLAQYAFQRRVPPARGSVGILLQWLKGRTPSSEDLLELGNNLESRKNLRTLELGARSLVYDVPALYVRYRRRCLELGKFYEPRAKGQSNLLSPSEVDINLLVMLRNARRARSRQADAPWLKPLNSKYLTQVAIDEATDFSSLQLACMVELSHPNLRSWFACGDFLQRITQTGVRSEDELNWIQQVTNVGAIEIQRININYRQSAPLQALSKALATGVGEPVIKSSEPPPLLIENVKEAALATWLGQRIIEVERSVNRLPSIAVFVDGEDKIDPLVGSVAPLLAKNTIEIVGCRDGRTVGNLQEVRVFDIRHIKGLEFEAVFFVAIDKLARRLPDLVQKYIYVGVTRAATFLALTCEGELPTELNFARPFFSSKDWSA